MRHFLELRIGPFQVASLMIVLGLIATAGLWTARLHRYYLSQKPDRPLGYSFGLAAGVWFRSILVAIAGVLTLFGSLAAYVFFSAGVIWRAIQPGREAVSGFLAGYEESSGTSRPGLASAFGAAWIAITRGIPLLLLYGLLGAA